MASPEWVSDLVRVTGEALDNINKIDDLIDNYLDPLTDITETVGQVVAPVKALRSLYTAATRMRFKAFIRSYARSLGSGSIEPALQRMEKYSERKKTRDLIYQTIDDAIHSRSVYAAKVLGHVAAITLLSSEEPDLKSFIIITALRELNDLELECAVRIFEASDYTKPNDVKTTKGLLGAQNEYTVERLKKLLLLEPGTNRTIADAGDWGKYQFSEITEELIDYLRETGVYEELLHRT